MLLIRFSQIIFSVIICCALSMSYANTQTAEEFRTSLKSLVAKDLLQAHRNDVFGKTPADIAATNIQVLQSLDAYQPKQPTQKRVYAVDRDFAVATLRSINRNPIVSDYALYDYKNGLEIGFCFGRATYVHLALLRAGVNKDSIKKVWVVGPMESGGLKWQFHVATAVLSTEGQWLVMDTFSGSVMTVAEWLSFMNENSQDNKLRLYVTNPEKFSVALGKYDRVQMGLDLSAEQDWYSHYFVKLMKWMGTHPLSDVGLYDLRQ